MRIHYRFGYQKTGFIPADSKAGGIIRLVLMLLGAAALIVAVVLWLTKSDSVNRKFIFVLGFFGLCAFSVCIRQFFQIKKARGPDARKEPWEQENFAAQKHLPK